MGLFNRFKKDSIQNKPTNTQTKEYDFSDFEITPEMYNFIPPETTIKSTPSIPTLETAIKEGQDKLEKSYSEANKAASYIEGGIHQLNNAQTADMQNFISDIAKSTQYELSERSF